jgi:PilZ domain
MEHRRRAPRLSAGWFGICHIEGESEPESRDCKVVDVSILGLGITLHHFWPSELVGRHISVEAPAVGDSVNVRLEGVIRNADPLAGGVVRCGIEFDGVTESELAVAHVLGSLIEREVVVPQRVAEEESPDYAIAKQPTV